MKGINPLEAHCEKILLVIVMAVAIGIVVLQFTAKSTVKVGPQEVEVHRAYGEVETQAERVISQLDMRVDELPELPSSTGLSAFEEQLAGSVAPKQSLAVAFGDADEIGAGLDIDDSDLGTDDVRIATVTVPAPGDVVTATVGGTVHPVEYVDQPEVRAIIPNADVPDVLGISLQTSYDGTSLARLLATDPDGSGPVMAVPRNWWQQGVEFLGLAVDREERLPDGSWGKRVRLDPMPGRLALAKEASEAERLGELNAIVETAVRSAKEVRRPEWYASIFGPDWVPPSVLAEEDLGGDLELSDEAKSVMRKLERQLAEVERLERSLEKAGGERRDQERPGGRERDGGARGPGRNDNRDRDRDNDRNERAIARLQGRLDNALRQVDDAIEELLDLGVDPKNIPGYEPELGMDDEQLAWRDEEIDLPLLEDDDITMWTHDVTAVRGTTYRYRVAVAINNPFFGHDTALTEEQRELAEKPVMLSELTGWSDPIELPDESYFFITGASDGSGQVATGTRANATVAAFRWGYWRTGSVRLEPGDVVVGTVEAPELGELFGEVLERVEAQVEGDRPDAGPAGRPGRRPGVSPGREREPQPGRRPGIGVPDRPGRPGQMEVVEVDVEDIEFEDFEVVHDAVLLGVLAAPGDSDDRYAMMRRQTGAVEAMSPAATRSNELYLRIRKSSDDGRASLAPKAVDEDPRSRERPEAPPERPPLGPPGGGGGGGG